MAVEKLKSDIEKFEKQLSLPSLPASAKSKIQEKLNSAKAELEKLEGGKKKESKPKKKTAVKKEKKSDTKKSEKKQETVEPEKKLSIDDCREVLKKFKSDNEKKKKSAKKSRSRSTSTRVSANVVQAIETAIESVPASEISANPAREIKKFERLKKAGEEFLQAFKSVLGDEYSTVDIKKELKEIDELIDSLIKKHK